MNRHSRQTFARADLEVALLIERIIAPVLRHKAFAVRRLYTHLVYFCLRLPTSRFYHGNAVWTDNDHHSVVNARHNKKSMEITVVQGAFQYVSRFLHTPPATKHKKAPKRNTRTSASARCKLALPCTFAPLFAAPNDVTGPPDARLVCLDCCASCASSCTPYPAPATELATTAS